MRTYEVFSFAPLDNTSLDIHPAQQPTQMANYTRNSVFFL